MTTEQAKALQHGDIVRHKNGAHFWVVTQNYGNRVTLVRSSEITNPDEWDLIFKANHTLVKAPEVEPENPECLIIGETERAGLPIGAPVSKAHPDTTYMDGTMRWVKRDGNFRLQQYWTVQNLNTGKSQGQWCDVECAV